VDVRDGVKVTQAKSADTAGNHSLISYAPSRGIGQFPCAITWFLVCKSYPADRRFAAAAGWKPKRLWCAASGARYKNEWRS
jgi:hypothetical protein